MLRRIGRHQLRLGMFVERIEGDWLDHPFWRTSFLVTDEAALARLRASGAPFVVIDESRGVPARGAPPATATAPAGRPPGLRPAVVHADEAVQEYRRATGQLFADARSARFVRPERSSRIVREIEHALGENLEAVVKLTRLKSIDGYTYTHSVAVSALMMGFARHLGLGADETHQLGVAGLLHDIGKVALPPGVLSKTTPLVAEEIELVRLHPRTGFDIAERSGFSQTVCDVTLHHHERLDGSGYPEGLSGTQISPAARIAAICDVFDAVTSLRPYKRAWSAREALRQMTRWEGHFDRGLLAEFVLFIGIGDEAPQAPGEDGEDEPPRPFVVNAFSDPSAPASARDVASRAGD